MKWTAFLQLNWRKPSEDIDKTVRRMACMLIIARAFRSDAVPLGDCLLLAPCLNSRALWPIISLLHGYYSNAFLVAWPCCQLVLVGKDNWHANTETHEWYNYGHIREHVSGSGRQNCWWLKILVKCQISHLLLCQV